jgi:hypothetical protein
LAKTLKHSFKLPVTQESRLNARLKALVLAKA